MKKQGSDAYSLIALVLIFVVSFRFLHGIKPRETRADSDVWTLTPQDTVDYIQQFALAGNLSPIARVIDKLEPHAAVTMLRLLVADESSPLTVEQKLEVIFTVALEYADHPVTQRLIFDIVRDYQAILAAHDSVFLIAAHANAQDVIPDFVGYIRSLLVQDKAAYDGHRLFTRWSEQALSKSIDNNDVAAFKKLHQVGVRVDKQFAQTLLTAVILQKKSADFIPLIFQYYEIDPNSLLPGSSSFLMQAAEVNNLKAAEQLVQAGAYPDLVVNKTTAPEVAFKKGNVAVELFLKKKIHNTR